MFPSFTPEMLSALTSHTLSGMGHDAISQLGPPQGDSGAYTLGDVNNADKGVDEALRALQGLYKPHPYEPPPQMRDPGMSGKDRTVNGLLAFLGNLVDTQHKAGSEAMGGLMQRLQDASARDYNARIQEYNARQRYEKDNAELAVDAAKVGVSAADRKAERVREGYNAQQKKAQDDAARTERELQYWQNKYDAANTIAEKKNAAMNKNNVANRSNRPDALIDPSTVDQDSNKLIADYARALGPSIEAIIARKSKGGVLSDAGADEVNKYIESQEKAYGIPVGSIPRQQGFQTLAKLKFEEAKSQWRENFNRMSEKDLDQSALAWERVRIAKEALGISAYNADTAAYNANLRSYGLARDAALALAQRQLAANSKEFSGYGIEPDELGGSEQLLSTMLLGRNKAQAEHIIRIFRERKFIQDKINSAPAVDGGAAPAPQRPTTMQSQIGSMQGRVDSRQYNRDTDPKQSNATSPWKIIGWSKPEPGGAPVYTKAQRAEALKAAAQKAIAGEKDARGNWIKKPKDPASVQAELARQLRALNGG